MISNKGDLIFRRPISSDGASVHVLVSKCPPLDPNSMYCNLLQCTHFSNTSVGVFSGNQLVGFISGYLIPERPDTLFIWQVAVDSEFRSQGLATRMLFDILSRPECSDVSWIETTITTKNDNSWMLFNRLTEKLDTDMVISDMFDCHEHFKGANDTELLVRIGPFLTPSPSSVKH